MKILNKSKGYFAVSIALLFSVLLSACQVSSSPNTQVAMNNQANAVEEASKDIVYVVMLTALGRIEMALYRDKAPVTVNNFLRYIDSGKFNGGNFYRVVRPDNDNGSPAITVIQAGVKDPDNQFPPIVHETTEQTGVMHLDGTLSMARLEPGTANSDFVICIGAQPALDFAGKRNPDLQGFAAFGRVTKGMDVVRSINQIRDTKQDIDPYLADQMLREPVTIIRFRRL